MQNTFFMQKYAWKSCKNAILEFKWAFQTFWSKIEFQVHHAFKNSHWTAWGTTTTTSSSDSSGSSYLQY